MFFQPNNNFKTTLKKSYIATKWIALTAQAQNLKEHHCNISRPKNSRNPILLVISNFANSI